MKKWISLLLALCLCLSLCACSSGDYKKATNAYTQGDYAAAALLFEQLGDYKDSAELLKDCRYQQALQRIADEEYDEALALLEPLGEYKDSAERIPACRYGKALQLMDKGNYDEALALLEPLGEYQDSAEQARECRYQMAMRDYGNGKVKETVDALSSIYDYPAAKQALCQLLLDELAEHYLSHMTDVSGSYNAYSQTWSKQMIAIANRTPAGKTFQAPDVDEKDPDILAMNRSLEKAGGYLDELRGMFSDEVLERCQDEALSHFFEVLQASHESFVSYFDPAKFKSRFELAVYYGYMGQSPASLAYDYNTAVLNLKDAAEALGGLPDFG